MLSEPPRTAFLVVAKPGTKLPNIFSCQLARAAERGRYLSTGACAPNDLDDDRQLHGSVLQMAQGLSLSLHTRKLVKSTLEVAAAVPNATCFYVARYISRRTRTARQNPLCRRQNDSDLEVGLPTGISAPGAEMQRTYHGCGTDYPLLSRA